MTTFDSGNWRRHPAHLDLLSRFRFPTEPKDFDHRYWELALGEPADIAIRRFMSEGWLVPATLTARLDLTYRVVELKSKLRSRGLPVSGRKNQLIARLVNADRAGLEKEFAGRELLECSPLAREVAERYVAEQVSARDSAEAQCLAFLKQHDFSNAAIAFAKFEAEENKVFPVAWEFYLPRTPQENLQLLKRIFGPLPRILQGLPECEREPLRIAAAMDCLWGTNHASRWLPASIIGIPRLGPDTTARMLIFHAQHCEDLNSYRSLGFTKFNILTTTGQPSDNSCEVCQRFAGHTYSLDMAPELPYEHCTSERGCRCQLLPITS